MLTFAASKMDSRFRGNDGLGASGSPPAGNYAGSSPNCGKASAISNHGAFDAQ
jgi:hypothetical protein